MLKLETGCQITCGNDWEKNVEYEVVRPRRARAGSLGSRRVGLGTTEVAAAFHCWANRVKSQTITRAHRSMALPPGLRRE